MIKFDMQPSEVVDKLNAAMLLLQDSNMELKKLSIKMAEAKKEYSIALAKEILKLKQQGCQVTVLLQIAKGEKTVAQLRFNKDVAESSYYVQRDTIDNLKAEIDTLRSLLSFMKMEYENY